MEKNLVYTGKTKNVYALDNGNYLLQFNGHGGHGDAAGHLNGGKQGVQTVHGPPVHRDADDGQGSVSGKSPSQVGGHAGGADEHTEAVGSGTFGKLRRRGRKYFFLLQNSKFPYKMGATIMERGFAMLFYACIYFQAFYGPNLSCFRR